MLVAENIRVKVGDRSLLSDVDLRLEPGMCVSLMGPNGAGKSTLLKVLTGEIKPLAGRVLLNGAELDAWRVAQRARLRAVLPQHLDLAFPFSAWEVALLGRMPHHRGVPGLRDREVVAEVMRLLDVFDLAGQAYTRLSGGERARVQLARVFAQIWDEPADRQPRYLLLDEPTAALDIAHQLDLMQRLGALLERGVGVLMILHDINLAATHADQVVMLRDGAVKAVGAPPQVMTPDVLREVFSVEACVIADPRRSNPVIVFDAC